MPSTLASRSPKLDSIWTSVGRQKALLRHHPACKPLPSSRFWSTRGPPQRGIRSRSTGPPGARSTQRPRSTRAR